MLKNGLRISGGGRNRCQFGRQLPHRRPPETRSAAFLRQQGAEARQLNIFLDVHLGRSASRPIPLDTRGSVQEPRDVAPDNSH